MLATTILKSLVLMATLLTIGTTAAPVAEPGFNTTGADFDERSLAPMTRTHRDLRLKILDMHNAVRKLHHAPPLKWRDHLAAYAQRWSDQCTIDHSMGPYGENIFGIEPATGVSDWTKQTEQAVNAWTSECEIFPWNDPQFTAPSGHFAQIVWQDTKEIGCAWNVVNCGGNEDSAWLVCEFYPPGNIRGYFKQNVLPA